MVFSDESFLPQIVGLFYATFDPKLGPTVLHQVPENLITQTSQNDETRSTSSSRSPAPSRSPRRRDRLSNINSTNNNSNNNSPSHAKDLSLSSLSLRSNNGRSRSRNPFPSSFSKRSSSRSSSHSSSSSNSTGPTLLDFAPISDYVIPKKSLHGKLVTLLTSASSGEDDLEGGIEQYRVMGFPSVLTGEGGRYQRNEYMWNLCFVFHVSSSLEAFEPVVRKCGRILRSAELDSAYLSSPSPDHLPLPAVLEQLFEDLNSYSETSINLDGFNSLELKLFPFFPNPPDCEDWHVPVALADINALKDDNWDITAARVAEHIDGVNHVARIAQLSDADEALTREVLKHMLYYQVIMTYSNMYTLKPNITRLSSDITIMNECAPYVTRPNYPRESWPSLLRLYTKLLPGVTMHDWVERNEVIKLGIDPRRFVSFGIIKGFLRRIHRWPIILDRGSPEFTAPFESIEGGRRRVGFDKHYSVGGRNVDRVESSLALSARTVNTVGTAGTNGTGQESISNSQLTRSGPGDSTFTLRSQGSNLSLGVSPGKSSSTGIGLGINKSPRRAPQAHGSTSIYPNHPNHSNSHKIGTSLPRSLHSGPGDSGISNLTSSRRTPTGMLRAGSALKMRNAAANAQGAMRLLEDILRYCDGSHHADEIQVKFGISWKDLEKILGLDGIKDGKVGKKGVVVIHR